MLAVFSLGLRAHTSPEGKREASLGLVAFWQHAPGHQIYNECFLFSMLLTIALLVEVTLCIFNDCTEWAWSRSMPRFHGASP